MKSDSIFKINGKIDESVVKITRGVKQGGIYHQSFSIIL
jgi:hypothetical protein